MIADANLRNEIDLLLQITNSGKLNQEMMTGKRTDEDAVNTLNVESPIHNPSFKHQIPLRSKKIE